MGRLIKSFFFKLSRDLTFRIVLIIGAGIAFFMAALMLFIDVASGALGGGEDASIKMLTGPNMLLSSFSPVDNFGLAIPICLITFICLEFTQGTIRNKIIAGHSKFQIYTALFISGLVLTFSLLIVYVGLCTLLGTIFGGFNLDDPVINMSSLSAMLASGAHADGAYIAQMLVTALVVYIAIVSFTIFFATLFRNIGPCIPIVVIVLMMLALGGTMVTLIADALENDTLVNIVKILDPLFVISGGGLDYDIVVVGEVTKPILKIETSAFIATIINNIVVAGAFFAGGALIFSKRDVK